MKRILIHSHVLAAFLQLAPLVRVAQTAPGVVAAPTLFILRWVFGAAAVAGSMHGLSGATGVVPATVRATNGIRTSVTFSITSSSHGTARSYSAVSGLPPGTTLSTRGTLTGTPTASGPFTLMIRGWETTSLGGNWADLNVALTVVGANPPVVTSQPASLTVAPGQPASLTVAYSGDQPVALRWFKEDLEVKNATNATLTLPSAQAADSGRYRLRLINGLATVFSDWATLTVQAAVAKPVITTQPVGRALHAGEGFSLGVSATGSDLTYVWTRDGVAVGSAGPPGPTLVVTNVTATAAGEYRVRITNPGGFVDSDGATVSVAGPVVWDSPTLVSDSLRLSFNGLSGRRYAIESAAAMPGPFSVHVEMMSQLGGTVLFDPIVGSGRVYRVRPLP
ncbi:MAG: immunoglobulin domain-containing protein [Verrucomicrobiota bacterium]|nr:immunoglobulin domain-containing protein [Verrucomicrobiota bacterium]